jgi:CysZ protein
MTTIFRSFFLSLGQFGDPVFQRILGASIFAALGVLWAIALGLSWVIAYLLSDGITLPLIGTVLDKPLSIGWSSFFIAIGLSVFLMVPVASSISSLFVDRVARAVETRHYPNIPMPRPQTIADALRDTFGFLGILIAANIVSVVLYIILPMFSVLIFWGLNGYLLGREYFQMAASRHVGRPNAKLLWRKNRFIIWTAGILMVAPLSIPIVNLIVPVLAAATFTHLYHSFPMVPFDDKDQYLE